MSHDRQKSKSTASQQASSPPVSVDTAQVNVAVASQHELLEWALLTKRAAHELQTVKLQCYKSTAAGQQGQRRRSSKQRLPTQLPAYTSDQHRAVLAEASAKLSSDKLRLALQEALSKVVSASVLRHLELGVKLSTKLYEQLGTALASNSSLEVLSFAGSCCGDAALAVILPPLANHPKLQVLELSGCSLTDASANRLATLLKAQGAAAAQQAWVLGLRGGAGSATQSSKKHGIADEHTQGLRVLDISQDQFTGAALPALASAIADDRISLVHLSLAGNQLPAAETTAATFLQALLQDPPSRSFTVDLRGNFGGKSNLADGSAAPVVDEAPNIPHLGVWAGMLSWDPAKVANGTAAAAAAGKQGLGLGSSSNSRRHSKTPAAAAHESQASRAVQQISRQGTGMSSAAAQSAAAAALAVLSSSNNAGGEQPGGTGITTADSSLHADTQQQQNQPQPPTQQQQLTQQQQDVHKPLAHAVTTEAAANDTGQASQHMSAAQDVCHRAASAALQHAAANTASQQVYQQPQEQLHARHQGNKPEPDLNSQQPRPQQQHRHSPYQQQRHNPYQQQQDGHYEQQQHGHYRQQQQQEQGQAETYSNLSSPSSSSSPAAAVPQGLLHVIMQQQEMLEMIIQQQELMQQQQQQGLRQSLDHGGPEESLLTQLAAVLGGLSDHVEQLEQLYQLSPPKQQLQPAALSAPADSEEEIDSQHTDEQRDLWARVGREAAAVAAAAAPAHDGITNGEESDLRHSRVQHDLWAKLGREAAAAAAEAADASVFVRRAIQGRSAGKSIAAAVAAGDIHAADAGVLPSGLDTQLQNGDNSRSSSAAEGAAAALKRYRNQSAARASHGQKVVDTDWRAVDDISRQLFELHGLS